MLHEADPTFVKKAKMVRDPSAPGAAPVAVLCKDVNIISDFSLKYKNVYKYEVLRGLHTLMAKKQLAQEYQDNPFYSNILADVYVGLTDEEALRLAHEVTHRNLVCCVCVCVVCACVCGGGSILSAPPCGYPGNSCLDNWLKLTTDLVLP